MGTGPDGSDLAAACSDDASDLANSCGQFVGLIQSQTPQFMASATDAQIQAAIADVHPPPAYGLAPSHHVDVSAQDKLHACVLSQHMHSSECDHGGVSFRCCDASQKLLAAVCTLVLQLCFGTALHCGGLPLL